MQTSLAYGMMGVERGTGENSFGALATESFAIAFQSG
jgi:hypothetical protein